MINKTHVPCTKIDIDDFWGRLRMGGSTGMGKGNGITVGDVYDTGSLVCWYAKERNQFPGSGTFNGSGDDDGSGRGSG